jgi:hypothetical protein
LDFLAYQSSSHSAEKWSPRYVENNLGPLDRVYEMKGRGTGLTSSNSIYRAIASLAACRPPSASTGFGDASCARIGFIQASNTGIACTSIRILGAGTSPYFLDGCEGGKEGIYIER